MSVGLVADLPRQRSLDGLDQSPRTTKSRIIETRGRRQERARDRSARIREPSGTAPDRELGRDLVGFGARGWSGEGEVPVTSSPLAATRVKVPAPNTSPR
jgi:hypothetical protein